MYKNPNQFIVKGGNTLCFAGKEWNKYKNLTSNASVLSLFDERYKLESLSKKKAHRRFSDKYGITPSRFMKVFNGKMNELHIKPLEPFVKDYCFKFGGKIDETKISRVKECKNLLEELYKDNLRHISPICLALKKSPSECKNFLGKSLWKELCKNSFTRNLHLYKITVNNKLSESVDKILKNANTFPSKILKTGIKLFNYTDCEIYAYKYKPVCQKSSYMQRMEFRTLCTTYIDTQDMAIKLGKPFKSTWTLQQMQRYHEKYAEEITMQKYSKNIFLRMVGKGFPDNIKGENGFTAHLIKSPFDLQQEGRTMRHCVASYADSVALGNYLVYSIKKRGERYSTLGIAIHSGQTNKYKFSQHYMSCNRHVERLEATDLANEVVNLLNIDIDNEDYYA